MLNTVVREFGRNVSETNADEICERHSVPDSLAGDTDNVLVVPLFVAMTSLTEITSGTAITMIIFTSTAEKA